MKTIKQQCEYLRSQAKQEFDNVRSTWCDLGQWGMPHRTRWLLSQTPGKRKNHHIVDGTHILAHRSYVAGFLEGNTSATRPWFRSGTRDVGLNTFSPHKEWLGKFTRRCHQVLNRSNYYNAAAIFYADFGVFNTGCHFVEKTKKGLHFHTLLPGSYYVINNAFGDAIMLIREYTMTVKALVDTYGKKKNGEWDWSNFTDNVKKAYNESQYTKKIDVVSVVMKNEHYQAHAPEVLMNKPWVEYTYELGSQKGGHFYAEGIEFGYTGGSAGAVDDSLFLREQGYSYKPFIVGRSTPDYEYGENGPLINCLGAVKSLNKKAISKDQALEQILRPALQGPAALRKTYITSSPNSFVPLDPTSAAQKGLRPIFDVNPAIGALLQDVGDLRQIVDKFFYADFLLYLSKNPKTRTKAETDAIIQEQQLIVGPNLQSLNWTYNLPTVELVMEHVLLEDDFMQENPVPEDLEDEVITPEFISVFAQAQKAADLPQIERYVMAASNLAQINPQVWDKVNLDKLMDLYEDRLYLPAGLNNEQSKVEAVRKRREQQAMQQQQLQETIPALAKAQKDIQSSKQN